MMSISSARVRKHEDSGRMEILRLPAELHGSSMVEESAVHRDADQRHDLGLEAPDLAQEMSAPGRELFRTEVGDARRGSIDEVHESEPVLRKRCILLAADVRRNETGLAQEPPEAVGVPCKVVPQSGGAHARVDADEKDAEPGRHAVGERLASGACSFRAASVSVPSRLRHE